MRTFTLALTRPHPSLTIGPFRRETSGPIPMPISFKPNRRDVLLLSASLLPALQPSLSAQSPAMKEFTNSLGMQFVPIPAGSFDMGESRALPDELLVPLSYPSRADLTKRYPNGDPTKFAIPFDHARHGDFDERPVHRVTISRSFLLGATQEIGRAHV